MPAGSSGETMRPGGGERTGEDPLRVAPSKTVGDGGRSPKRAPEVVAVDSQVQQIEAFADAGHLLPKASPMVDPVERWRGLPPSVERFIGWGFHDWMEASDAQTQQVVKQLELARAGQAERRD